MAPTVIYRPLVVSLSANVAGYHPTTGQRPGYGRLEIVPPPDRPQPPPAPTYYRSWSSGSAPGPVTDYAPYNGPAAVGIEQNIYTAAATITIRRNRRARPVRHRKVREIVVQVRLPTSPPREASEQSE